jgi:hypothetical protein
MESILVIFNFRCCVNNLIIIMKANLKKIHKIIRIINRGIGNCKEQKISRDYFSRILKTIGIIKIYFSGNQHCPSTI